MAGRLGIDSSKIGAYPSQALGAGNTNVLDMAEAFSVFANDGVRRDPTFVTKIEGPDGEVLYEADTTGTEVLPAQLARTETLMLRDVITDGTYTAGRHRPARCRQDGNIERDERRMVHRLHAAVHGRGVDGELGDPGPDARQRSLASQGAAYPAAIWAAFMEAAHENLPAIDFTAPDEAQFAGSARIDEFGRGEESRAPSRPRSRSTGTTAPGTEETTPAVAARGDAGIHPGHGTSRVDPTRHHPAAGAVSAP